MNPVEKHSNEEAAKLACYLCKEGLPARGLNLLYKASEGKLPLDAAILIVQKIDSITNSWPVSKSFGVAVVQYLRSTFKLDAEPELSKQVLRFLYERGLAKYVPGGKPTVDSWADPAQFIIDESQIQQLVKQELPEGLSEKSAFEALRVMMLLRTNLIEHKTFGDYFSYQECFLPENFEHTPEYDDFLKAEQEQPEPQIADLTAIQVSRLAHELSISSPRNVVFKFLYRATCLVLTFDTRRVLSQKIGVISSQEFASALSEYLVKTADNEIERQSLQADRLARLYGLGLATPISEELSDEEWEDPTKFKIDEAGITTMMTKVLGSYDAIKLLRAARLRVGMECGFVRHKSKASINELAESEFFNDSQFEETDEYRVFLDQREIGT